MADLVFVTNRRTPAVVDAPAHKTGVMIEKGAGLSLRTSAAVRLRSPLSGGADRVLEVKKTNYGPNGEKLKLRWDDGCFVLESAASVAQQPPHRQETPIIGATTALRSVSFTMRPPYDRLRPPCVLPPYIPGGS
jgi:hypothetical protein